MKTILFYGDSLTWGTDPETGLRHQAEMRVPDALASALGDGFEVISEGLRGRCTAYDEHLADCDRNGARALATSLYTHAPLDLVILMLGTNDMKPHIAGTWVAAQQGMRRLVKMVKHHVPGPGMPVPRVLVVSPPPLCETPDVFFAEMFKGGIEQSAKLADAYQLLAAEEDAGFFDGAAVAETSPLDGVHLNAENSARLGKGLAPAVQSLLA